MRTLRLLSVRVQPIVVLDDGDTLESVDHPVIEIPAAEWPTYSAERFPRELEAWQAQMEKP